jgi:hypothetical protein
MLTTLARLGLLAGAVLLPASLALADTPPSPQPAASDLDPDRLVLARQIVAIVLPPDRAMAIMDSISKSIMRPLETMLRQQVHSSDPGLNAIFSDFLNTMPATLHATMQPLLPEQSEAMARAYARKFDRNELTQILVFGQTPVGAKYLSRSTELMQDPDIQAFYARLVPAVQAQQAPQVAEFKRKIAAYLAAHPEVAKQVRQSSGN